MCVVNSQHSVVLPWFERVRGTRFGGRIRDLWCRIIGISTKQELGFEPTISKSCPLVGAVTTQMEV